MELKLTTDRHPSLQVRSVTHCATPPKEVQMLTRLNILFSLQTLFFLFELLFMCVICLQETDMYSITEEKSESC